MAFIIFDDENNPLVQVVFLCCLMALWIIVFIKTVLFSCVYFIYEIFCLSLSGENYLLKTI